MWDFIANHQLNMMLALSGICGTLAILIVIAKALTVRRRFVLVLMELEAMLLVFFDRLAYIYSGDIGSKGYIMVRVSNFFVFFLTSGMVLAFNLYVIDLLLNEGKMKAAPKRLRVTLALAVIGMLVIVVSQFTGRIYYFDEFNKYHRGSLFLLSYVVPIIAPLIQLSVIIQYRKHFTRVIFISLVLYVVVPITAGIVQIFTYGLSLVNMAMVVVALALYIFAYLDINESVEKAHRAELLGLDEGRRNMRRLLGETAVAFADAVEMRSAHDKGHALRVAERSKRIAQAAGKNDEECDGIYYTALLHDVGMAGISEDEIEESEKDEEKKKDLKKKKALLGGEILSKVTGFPDLKAGAMYGYERYDGTGFPEGRKGENIPDPARIIGVANAYDEISSFPSATVREEFVKEAGLKYDPEYSRIMVEMIDSETEQRIRDEAGQADKNNPDSELDCGEYRKAISRGIDITQEIVRISFSCEPDTDKEQKGAPSLVLYDSLDGAVHDTFHSIRLSNYLEYGEVWFDGHIISTGARNMEAETAERSDDKNGNNYEIIAGRYGDHLMLKMISPGKEAVVTVALQDSTRSSYLAITGEWCHIRNINVEKTGGELKNGDIKRIADVISYIDRMESDIPNIQIDRSRSAATAGIPIKNRMVIRFHTRSLPTAYLVWHCPYILLFTSADMRVGGADYHEYEMIKLNGENNGSNEYADSHFVLKKEDFEGWDAWMEKNQSGMECEISFQRRGSRIIMTTDNMGISIHETVTLKEDVKDVYVSLTGDQCALTDIRIEAD